MDEGRRTRDEGWTKGMADREEDERQRLDERNGRQGGGRGLDEGNNRQGIGRETRVERTRVTGRQGERT
ncbi:hypothetical protein Pmani_036827 [Petrolisthes manimaculis]|uniref:Uncharacterized protein n=1 Tax=Petrolisthes manimaculis TaxID=1843537 RepID=A0AAE1TMA9_9EUCA|nr:hypothetical protein Pmani_036827 [Petrolisthes manimaculis]